MLTFGDAQGEDEESSLPHIDHGFHSKLPPGILPHGLPTVKEVAPAVTPQEQKTKDNDKKGKWRGLNEIDLMTDKLSEQIEPHSNHFEPGLSK